MKTGKLIQLFDVYLEGKANGAVGYNPTGIVGTTVTSIQNDAYKSVFGNTSSDFKSYYLNGAPWLGNPELVKLRIDLFVNGKAGYINDKYLDYTNNEFYNAIKAGKQFKEEYINYSYTGQTIETEDGDSLVVGASAKDKTIIIYTMLP